MRIACEGKEIELVNAMKNGITEAIGITKEIGDRLLDCSCLLRVEHSEEVFNALLGGINNLSDLVDFIKELKRGMETLKDYSQVEPFLSSWDGSLKIFEDMLPAFESKDWITLSDLIQYELHPFLVEGEKGLSELNEIL
ncbi:MAG: hypothetical protein HY739_07900 [Desulfobacterales bacterium]|jgi:hypothetical protein|nr:hypothetical protein [Desulfobacterales bacterium]